MAGAGYKLFNTGDVLTAAQVNTYLMEQTVMVFANAAARTTALSGVVSEGMISYLKDTNAVEVYDGSNWVSSDDPNAIQNTIVDAKGDLITATAADTPARLAVGSNGDTLVADSAQTTGLRYNPPVGSLANPVINGAFDIWQRGTSSTTVGAYVADRWWNGNLTGATYSRQTTSDTTNLPNIQYCLRIQRNSGVTATDGCNAIQSFETVNSIPFAGKTVTLSFYARKGANLSGDVQANLHSGTGTDQFFWTGYTGSATPISATLTTSNLTTNWQRFAYSGTISSSATELALQFNKTSAGTAGAADYVEITGVQIDVGTWTASTAPTFRRSGGTIQGELVACQRYYYRQTGQSANRNEICSGWANSTTNAVGILRFPVTMRTAPVMSQSAAADYGFVWSAGSSTISGVAYDVISVDSVNIRLTTSGLTTGQGGVLTVNQNTTKWIEASAEL
jgi:hypothetical protein